MNRAFGFISGVAAVFAIAGCQEAKSKSPDASSKIDGQVIQTVAVGESTLEAKEVKVGDKGPAWENLTGTDDKQHSLKDLKESKAVAIIFTCNTCPVAQAYEDRLMKLATDYKDKGVSIVAINVNKDARNDLDAMKQRSEKKGFTFDYLTDPSQKIARDYGATCTPHVFLLDSDRKIAYTGAIDDDMNADAVKKHSLQDAIDAVLAGKAPEVAVTKQFGCGIHYE
jgi:peroxiredoxin